MPSSWTTRTLAVAILSLAMATRGQGEDSQSPKPENCEGVSTVVAIIPDIKDLNGNEFHQEVGKMNYSLSMTGNLVLNSTVSSWHCGSTKNEVISNSTMRTLTSVYGAGQQTCQSDSIPVDATWITAWNSIIFSGEVFFSVIVHDRTCASPPTIIDTNSPCTYNATTEGGMIGTGLCRWNITDKVHNAGDQPDGADGEGEEGGGGEGGS